jgi:hypothetical protein
MLDGVGWVLEGYMGYMKIDRGRGTLLRTIETSMT